MIVNYAEYDVFIFLVLSSSSLFVLSANGANSIEISLSKCINESQIDATYRGDGAGGIKKPA